MLCTISCFLFLEGLSKEAQPLTTGDEPSQLQKTYLDITQENESAAAEVIHRHTTRTGISGIEAGVMNRCQDVFVGSLEDPLEMERWAFPGTRGINMTTSLLMPCAENLFL